MLRNEEPFARFVEFGKRLQHITGGYYVIKSQIYVPLLARPLVQQRCEGTAGEPAVAPSNTSGTAKHTLSVGTSKHRLSVHDAQVSGNFLKSPVFFSKENYGY